jgi:hypothetical protein
LGLYFTSAEADRFAESMAFSRPPLLLLFFENRFAKSGGLAAVRLIFSIYSCLSLYQSVQLFSLFIPT